jgi:MFS family permease
MTRNFQTLGITSPALKTLINGCLQIWNLIMAVSASLLVDKVGRRPLFLISNAGMLLSAFYSAGMC